jgi:uncharacterized protein YdhG (YjbR/CyaY superfamily)
MPNAIKTQTARTVDEYIKRFPQSVQVSLKKLRATIKKAAPAAEEMISYGIAGYKYHGMLVFFAAFDNHISVYPAPRGAEEFRKELAAYKGGKGTVQFPLDKPIPYDLVRRIVEFRIKDNISRAEAKKLKKSKTTKKINRAGSNT